MIDVDVTLPLRSLRKIQAVAYDVNTDFIYWIDARAKSIRRSRDDGSQVNISARNLVVGVHFEAVQVLCSPGSVLASDAARDQCCRSARLGSLLTVWFRNSVDRNKFINV